MTELSWLGPLGDSTHRVFWPFLLGSVLLALVFARKDLATLVSPKLWLDRSSVLDMQLALVKTLARVAGLMPALGSAFVLAVALVKWLDRTVGVPSLEASPVAVTAAYTVTLFLAWDLSKYVLHRLLHEVPALWALHQVHHSAEVMTPLTYYRAHPIESLLFDLRGAVVTGVITGGFYWAFRGAADPWTLAGVNGLGFGFNMLGGNLRHSHVWLAFPAWAERWLISPVMHQLHHTHECERNYGTWLAVWDRLGGSLHLSGERRELVFGLAEDDCNHRPDDLLGALAGPLAQIMGPARWSALAALLVIVPVAAFADEGEESEEEDEDEDADLTVTIVDKKRGLPRVAGSAHTVEEEELERLEHDDIHRVLAPVPGVYVRGEDGYGLRPNIGLRGANSDRSSKVTLLEDGILLGPAPYAAPAAYYFPTTTRMVGVEVFKGPAATRHGPQTVGGAINLQTRAIPDGLDGGLDLAFGRHNTRKAHGWVGASGSWWGVMLEGVHLATDGFKVLDTGDATGFDKNEAMLKARIQSPRDRAHRQSLELKLGIANERSHETYLGLSDVDFAADPYRRYAASAEGLMSWDRSQTQLTWRAHFGPDVDLRVVGYYHYLERSWRKLNAFWHDDAPSVANSLTQPESLHARILRGEQDTADETFALAIGTNGRTFHSGGVQSTLRWRARHKIVSSELEIGVRVHSDQIERDHFEDPYVMDGGRPVLLDGVERRERAQNRGQVLAVAAHVHEELGIGPLRLLPGLRAELMRSEFEDRAAGTTTDAFHWVLLPGVGVHVQPTSWLSVLGGVHRGFSPVAPGQSEDTLPETSWAVEAGARVGYRGFRAEAIGFFNDYDNLSPHCSFSQTCVGDSEGDQYNAGRVFVYGAEVLVEQTVHLPRGMQLEGSISYTWTGSQFANAFQSAHPQYGDVSIGDKLPYVPEHQGTARLAFLFPRGSVEVVVKGQSDMRDAASQGELDEASSVPGYAVLDLGGEVNVYGPVTVYATLNNVTNAQYTVGRRPFGMRPGRPLHFMFGVKLRGLPELPKKAATKG